MAASSSGSQGHHVFPSFCGEDVRTTFLSHLLMALDRRSINSFRDNGIERSRPISPELVSAIREARISIVIFSKNYPSSTWCLNELVEIHKCYKELHQMVIPIFYDVDPSDVRRQTGEFGKAFGETCMGKPEDQEQRWRRVLSEVASIAGEDIRHYNLERPSEAHMVEKIANDVSNKLISPSNCFGEFVGIEAHLKAMNSILSLESKEARMVGIWGTSGIGKSTIGRALFSQLSSQFPLRNFVTYKSTDQDVFGMKSSWEQKFLSEILGQEDLKLEHSGVVEQRLKDKKVLIVLDDVDNLEFLKTLVGKTEWFGPGSRIIVITQNRHLLKAHDIDLLYEVKFPSQNLALKMLCRSAFEENSPPDDFKELAVKVAKLAGNLPLGLSVLGSFLKRRGKKDWMELLDRPENGLNGDIMKILSVSYNRLDEKDQYLFLYIACLLNGHSVKFINDFLGDVNTGLQTLADKSLIRITPGEIVEMHNLLEKLGTKIDRGESKGNLGKRRFLTKDEEILDVFTDKTGTGTLLGIFFKESSPSQIEKPFISVDENSFEGMLNLQFLKIHDHSRWRPRETRLRLTNGLVYLPRKLKYLEWNYCPLKCLPSNFKAEYLVELIMEDSELEKLWEGTQLLGSLKKMIMNGSKYLKEIPDLSKAINLEYLDLLGCPRLKNLPEILMQSFAHGIEIKVEDCLWNKNLPGLDYPSKFSPEHLVRLTVKGNMLEKLWEGVQSLGSLVSMDLSECGNLTEIPDLSKATNLRNLYLSNCKSLVTFPFTVGNLQNLLRLEMKECTGLEVLPVNVNLSSLKILDLSGCSSLRSFPQISKSIEILKLDDTAIDQVPCCVKNFPRLAVLNMRGCKKLKNISPNIFRLTSLKKVDFTDCGDVVTALSDATVKKRRTSDKDEDNYNLWYGGEYFNFQNCFKLDGDARELILRSCFRSTMVLPGGEVPTYFKHRAYGNSLTFTLPQSSLSHKFLRFKACFVVEPLTDSDAFMSVLFCVNGKRYMHTVAEGMPLMCKTNHLVLCSFKFWFPCKLDFNDVEFRFFNFEEIKECGIRLLNVSPYPCLEGEALCVDSMITEQQDAQIPIAQLLYDVFLSFHREDVRNTFLCHLLKELDRRSINTSINEKISIGRPISDLLLAIKGARISIVIFSKNYPSSRWCLNELVEIHKSYKKFDQIVMPVFYNVDPSDVRKQTGEFGKAFVKTCMGNPEDQIQRWSRVLSEVASMAGGDFRHYSLERPSASGAHMVEKIANDVSNKLISPSYCFG